MKDWEELAEGLSSEIKRELAETYFMERISLEKAWENFLEELHKEMQKKEEALLLNICRIIYMLKENHLIEEFEQITGFPLRACYDPVIMESKNIKRRVFSSFGSTPFGLTSKSRFIKLFLKIYENLYKAYQNYNKLLEDFEEEYKILKEETEKFYKRFDLSAILGFFASLSEKREDIGVIEEREKIHQSLTEKMKIQVPEPPSKLYEKYPPPKDPKMVKSQLINLIKRAFESHQKDAREILKLISEKD